METDDFVTAAIALMRRHCRLVAAYVIGSIATGDVAGQASDIDLLLVTDQSLPDSARRRAGEALADLATASALRGLEAVLYRTDVLARPTHPLPYELNVNAGPRLQRSVSTHGDAAFWFLLDVAAARQHALAYLGPPAEELIGDVAAADVKAALLESLQWQRHHGRPDADAALTACRGLHWLATGTWLSKSAAAEAFLRSHDSEVVRKALALRRAGVDGEVDRQGVADLQAQLEAALTS